MSINALLDEFKVKAATPKQQLQEYKALRKFCNMRLVVFCICLRLIQRLQLIL